MIIKSGDNHYVFGIPQIKPFISDIPGVARLRFRSTEFAGVFIRNGGIIREFGVIDAGDHFTTGKEIARNERHVVA